MTVLEELLRFFICWNFLTSLLACLVDQRPCVNPCFECFIFPQCKGLVVNYRRLDNFFSFEDTPSDCIDIVFFHVLVLISSFVNSLVSDIFMLVQMCNQWLYKIHWNKQFNVSLLVHIPILRSPPVFWIS